MSKKYDSTVRTVRKEIGTIKFKSYEVDELIAFLKDLKEKLSDYPDILLRSASSRGVRIDIIGYRNETPKEREDRKGSNGEHSS